MRTETAYKITGTCRGCDQVVGTIWIPGPLVASVFAFFDGRCLEKHPPAEIVVEIEEIKRGA